MSVSLPAMRPPSAAMLPCKICAGPAALFGVVDFHKCCEEANGFYLPLAGVPVYYRRCAACGFLFTDAFDDWSDVAFKAHIYNDGYHAVDPTYREIRPMLNAKGVTRMWGAHKAETRVLDFGGGSDIFCAALRADGFPVAVSYDPMVAEHARRPEQTFDLVTCFETLEHLPDPANAFATIAASTAEPGLVLYSTSTPPPDFDKRGLGWQYVSPRNGHISIFTKRALAVAWGRHGFKTVSLDDNVHVAFRTLPKFLSHLQPAADRLTAVDGAVQAA